MLKLKLQYFGHLRQEANSLEKTLMLGKTEGRKRRGSRGLGETLSSKELLAALQAAPGSVIQPLSRV